MKRLDHNAVDRSLALMGFRLAEQVRTFRHQDDAHRLAETQQQFQVPIHGTVGPHRFVDVKINFHEVIYYAPLQRDNKNEDPQFWWGAQMDTGDPHLSVHVKDWTLDEECNYLGATVRVSAFVPNYVRGTKGETFSGTLHATFQGLSLPIEDPGFDDTP